tara:strand:+ start:1533 stop:2471 length:939 start_codon:yes stop_codon:yes gene_type:complete
VNEETILMLDSDSNGFSATATCTIENPSTYSEEISVSYDGDGFTVVGPESATLDAGDSVDILVAISSTSADATLRNVTVDVDVTSVQGAPLPDFLDAFLPSDSSNIMAQVGEFVDLRASLQEDKLTLSSELMQPMSATLLVSNDGNVDDDVSITIQNAAQLEERNIGWNITNSGQDGTVQSNGGSATYTLRFNPNPDMMDESISVVIRVTSSFDNSQSTEVTLTLNTTAPEESILDLTEMNIPSWAYIAGGTLSFLVLVAIMASIRKRIKGASGAVDFDDDDDDDFDFDDDDLDDELEDDLDDLDDLDDFEF